MDDRYFQFRYDNSMKSITVIFFSFLFLMACQSKKVLKYEESKAESPPFTLGIDNFVKKKRLNCYAEDALNEILDILLLKPCYFNEFCVEIDDHEDLEGVRSYLNKN